MIHWEKKIRWVMLAIISLMTYVLPAQDVKQLNGSVFSENGEPLNGVNIVIKQSNNASKQGITTDAKGQFRIATLKAGTKYLISFSYVGYQEYLYSYSPKANDNLNLTIKLKQAVSNLNDVVVVGYGTSNKKDLTGAITSLKSEDFNTGVVSSPAELLQGKVAGLNVTKSGDPSQSPSVVLRGPSTIRTENGAQEPFYVIDGVPGASIDILAPSDIESIAVLKDAASTAIYGSRAANGIIIVTTKKAKPGQSRLTYNSYVSMQKVSKKIDMLSGNELRKYLSDNSLLPLSSPIDDDGSNTNWQNLVERKSYSQNHNLSFSGSSVNAEYGASVNYFKNDGIINRTSLERIIYRGYVTQRYFKDKLNLSLNFTNSTSNGNDVVQQYILPGMLFYLPTVSPFNTDGTYKENFTRTGSGTLNPLSLLDNNTIKTNDTKTLINGIVQFEIINGLKFTLSGSSQKDQYNYNSYFNSTSGLAVNLNGVAHRTSVANTNSILETYFNYNKSFGQHAFKLLAGYSYQQNRTNDGFGVQTQNFSNDNLTYNNLFLSNPASIAQIGFDNSPISTLRIISYYGRLQYQFSDKYLFQASLRDDGSSAFGANHRYGLFPAVSIGWKLINENFIKKYAFISDLKLRAGYGVSGNSVGFDAFSSILVYGTQGNGSRFLYNGNVTNAIGPVRNNNPDLKWESTATSNIGLDFGLFKNRITGSVDYYIKKTSDLIYAQYPVSLTQYFTNTITANAGNIKNSGIEVQLNAVVVKNKNFSWKTSLNFSHNKNIVESLSNGLFNLPSFYTAQLGGKGQSGNYSQIVQPGNALGTFYLWHYMGKNDAGVSTYLNAAGNTIATQPLTTDQRIAGNAQPKLIYGFSNSFTFKSFDFNFLIRGVTGNQILNATLANLNNPSDARLQNIPRFTLGESAKDINGYLISDRFLESGSYLRLDNATLGYSIKSKIPSIKSIRLYLTASNLFVITKYKGIDPEISMGGLTPGIDNNNFYPKTRSYLIGLSASF